MCHISIKAACPTCVMLSQVICATKGCTLPPPVLAGAFCFVREGKYEAPCPPAHRDVSTMLTVS